MLESSTDLSQFYLLCMTEKKITYELDIVESQIIGR